VKETKKSIKITAPNKIRPLTVETNPYPYFPTDLQAQLMAVLILGEGSSRITENVFPNRFIHVAELRKLGAQIKLSSNLAKIQGTGGLAGAKMQASDLRASAGLVLAALSAVGQSEIFRIYHLDRGYEGIDNKLREVGAKICRVKE
jgi:UDP-N-acetylglucosamine 1-carboxyvinyltransferase